MRRLLLALPLLALPLLALSFSPLRALAVEPQAEAAAFCLGVVTSAGQVFGMRPPLFMTRPEADLVMVAPDRRVRALTLAGDRWRAAGAIGEEAFAAARKAGSATLMRLLAEGGFKDADYRALRDTCRSLGDSLHGTDKAALAAAYEAAVAQMLRLAPAAP